MANYFLETQSHEWILSNKMGGYAIGTGNLVPQRKYHCLLTKSNEQFERVSLINTIEEEIEWRGESFNMDSNHYNNCIFPEGFLHLVKSWLRPYPIFLFSSVPHNDDILIKKEIMMDEFSNILLVKYTNLSSHKLHFKIRPKFTLRNHHQLNEPGTWDHENELTDIWKVHEDQYFKVCRQMNGADAFGWFQHGQIYHDRRIYRNNFYPWEIMKGYPGVEDLLTCFFINFELKPNESNYVLFSDSYFDSPNNVVVRIEKRYKKYPMPVDMPYKRQISKSKDPLLEADQEEDILSTLDYNDNILFDHASYMKILELAVSDFVANDNIVAGFPWFGAWGRDTMIALEGVLKLPKGAETAWVILKRYALLIKDGLIPNMITESGQMGNYTSLDATLWFVIRLFETCDILCQNQKTTQKQKMIYWKEVIDITEKVLNELIYKTHYDYRVREDGLIEMMHSFASATWMDAKVNNIPVTPRDGAPVEINALFYNALCFYLLMIERYNNIVPESKFYITSMEYIELKEKVKDSFHKFWIGDYLADRLYHDEPIMEYRPNAIIATSLPYCPLSVDKIQQVYECAHVELFTPYGLRTLSPRDPKFKKKYFGDQLQRDKSYHQGTVWAWLLLPFVKTWLKAYPYKSKNESINHISYLIEKFRNGFMRGHIASIAEVWDGDKPHFPKGAPCQAWSVTGIYVVEKILEEMEEHLA